MVINLYRMRMLGRTMEKLVWRMKQEESRAARMTASLTGMPRVHGNHSRVEEGAIRITDLKDAYRETMKELEEMRNALDPLIGTLEDADERAVMRLRYIDGYDAEQIADAVFRTDRMIYYILSRAEKKLARLYPDQVREGR